jgi:maltose alpha-D-glucosyltransferase/alpha-amylase
MKRDSPPTPDRDATWYKDAIVYQLHVRAFHDSNADGVGDFRGLCEKLDYLQELGVTAIWILPFYPSPLKDDGYDISDYMSVNPTYGVLRDFQTLLREAHRRGLRVITELVLNHTSDQHPWFQRARRAAPGSRYRDFYVWSDTTDRYQGARIIFQDFESSNWAWDPVAKAYYWHRFYVHQPDLNFENPEVHRALLQAVDFWLEMGVDGLRLDAVPYLYEQEGTTCENLPETHVFLKQLRRHVDENFPGRMLLAEANQWPEDAVAYFGDGDECHTALHFPLMPRLFMAVHMEDRFPILDILQQTPPIPENCQWAVFLRNHDELTLEMVTDEDRDYMYRVYAQDPQARINLGIRRRLAPLLANNRRRLELMNGLLFSLPGAPIIYYGDEIGMGDNIYVGDRNGVRTPMQWSGDRNAGFSRANPQRLYLPVITDSEYHYATVNVEAQQHNTHSLLSWMKRLIDLRKRYKAFARGDIELLYPENRKVLAFIRRHEDESILVVANMSRFVQYVELDLSAFKGAVPVELFGRSEFPPVGESRYFITLGPHAFYWFALELRNAETVHSDGSPETSRMPLLTLAGSWDEIFESSARSVLESVLLDFLKTRRWFGGKARSIQYGRIIESIPMRNGLQSQQSRLLLLRVVYLEGEPETYLMTVAVASGEAADHILTQLPQAVIAHLQSKAEGGTAVVYDALAGPGLPALLLDSVARRRRFKGSAGELVASPTQAFRALYGGGDHPLAPAPLKGEQSNSSIVYGDRLVLKMFRRPDTGVNPDLEIGKYLTEQAQSVRIPPVAGFIEYRRDRSEPMTLGVLQGFVQNEGDAWLYTLDSLRPFFERVLAGASGAEPSDTLPPSDPLVLLAAGELPALASDLIGAYLQSAELIGQRTAELHAALASGSPDNGLAPEAFTPLYQRSIYQSMRGVVSRVFPLLRKQIAGLPEDVSPAAQQVLDREGETLRRFQTVLDREITGMRIRCHGDYHLGQVLYTGTDFVITDFEGEPGRPLSERRLKRSPLRDVAGMLRSFHYAAYAALHDEATRDVIQPESIVVMEAWATFWQTWVSASFLKSYLRVMTDHNVLPRTQDEIQLLLDAFLLEKAVYELGYELNNRPRWVNIPLRGILSLLDER